MKKSCLLAVLLLATTGQAAGRPLEKAIKGYLQGFGKVVNSVKTAKSYQVSYHCDSVADCGDGVLPIGTAFKLYLTFQYSGAVVTLPGFYTSLLIYDSERQVIVDRALLSWLGSVRAQARPAGGWGRFRATFDDLFLHQELLEGAQLVIVDEGKDGNFIYHSKPIASIATEQGLSAPIEEYVLESMPPRLKWVLQLKTPVAGNIHVRWYVQDLTDGEIIEIDSFTTPADRQPSSELTVISAPDERWSRSCRMIHFHIDRNPIGENREIYRLPTVVAAKFSSQC